MLTIRWHDSEAAGFTDHLPEKWFSGGEPAEGSVHPVEGPRSEAYRAKCNVKVSGAIADLDYEAFKGFNTKQGMSLGVLRIRFTGQDRRTVSQVLWKEHGSSEFRPCSTTVGYERDEREGLETWFPEEVSASAGYPEGSVQRVLVNRYERDRRARKACVRHHGTSCSVCGFAFGAVYGSDFAGMIHVHHVRPLSECAGAYVVDPIKDLRPVCPNCHAVLHHGPRVRSIAEVKSLLKRGRGAQPVCRTRPSERG